MMSKEQFQAALKALRAFQEKEENRMRDELLDQCPVCYKTAYLSTNKNWRCVGCEEKIVHCKCSRRRKKG